jgi:uncharacterized RDD family membrane protein YckC
MDAMGVVGTCQEHVDRQGSPCGRCGTFRCGACLDFAGLCPSCAEAAGSRALSSADTAGFGRRAGARALDVVLSQAVGLVGGVLAGITLAILQLSGVLAAGWEKHVELGTGLGALIGLFSALSGHAVSTWLAGGSLGKVILGLRVVSSDNQRVGLGASLLRELAYFIDALFFGLVAYKAMEASPFNRRLGDEWANTTVVFARTQRAPVASTTLQLLIGIGAGFFVQTAILTTAFIVNVFVRTG